VAGLGKVGSPRGQAEAVVQSQRKGVDHGVVSELCIKSAAVDLRSDLRVDRFTIKIDIIKSAKWFRGITDPQ
jgi:hypothetical protein